MDNLARVRRASTEIVKVQRRVWLLQSIFWPVLILSVIVAGAAITRRAWRRRNAAAVYAHHPAPTPVAGP